MLLITGFGPFPLVPDNPSGQLARRVATQRIWHRIGFAAQALVMPTSYRSIEGLLKPALRNMQPDAVLMIGVAARTPFIRVETRAINRASILFADAGGHYPRAALNYSLGLRRDNGSPAASALLALRRAGISARASHDAGRYLCNAAYFHALTDAGLAGVPVLFVHIPLPRDRKPLKRGRPHSRRRPSLRDMETALLVLARHLAHEGRKAARRRAAR